MEYEAIREHAEVLPSISVWVNGALRMNISNISHIN